MRTRAFYQNNYSLLFQFIVSEYLAICQLVNIWEKEMPHMNYDRIKLMFIKLIGPQDDVINMYTRYFRGGLLAKLHNSCQLFAITDMDTLHPAQKLNGYVQKIARLCYFAWKMTEEEKAQPNKIFKPLLLFILKLQKCLKKFGRLIAKLFLQFENNETVLLFLLENHHAVDHVYQSKFTAKLFSKMFPKGIKDAEKFMIKQYGHRGYHHLLPRVAEATKELQKNNDKK